MKLEAFLKSGFFNQRFRVVDETSLCLFECKKGLYGVLVDIVRDDITNTNVYLDHDIIGFGSYINDAIVVCIRTNELNKK